MNVPRQIAHFLAIEVHQGIRWFGVDCVIVSLASRNDEPTRVDSAGNLTNVSYPVNTALGMKCDALKRLTNMVDAVGTTAYAYTSFGALLTEDGPWASDTVTLTYDNGRRRNGLNLQAPNASDWVQTYAYDSANRLSTLTSPAGTFRYQYFPGLDTIPSPSPPVQKLLLPNGAYITNGVDDWGRLLETTLKNSGNSVLNTHTYTLKELNQRTTQSYSSGSETYGYDALGQLISDSGQDQLRYSYDLAGNLTNRGCNLLTNSFTVNSVNQLSNSTRSGKLTVEGTTTSTATSVTVNSLSASLYSNTTFERTDLTLVDGTNTFTAIGQDSLLRKDTNTVSAYLPATVTFQYDANENLTNDGLRAFSYDDENELASVSVANAWKSDFTYDGKLRRRVRKESTWRSSSWVVTNEFHYVYDGNLVIQDRDANNLPLTAYTRGKDLSGSREGAGGIGGLLAFSQLSTLNPQHSFYHADGNGNVTMLINSLQLPVAKYLYDPFGDTLSSSGPLAEANLYRFSSKETHLPSGLCHYIYRFYHPNLQRWLSRAPAAEAGGMNLYVFTANNGINDIDPLGLDSNLDDPNSKCQQDKKRTRQEREKKKCNEDWEAGDKVCKQYSTPALRSRCYTTLDRMLQECLKKARNLDGVDD